MNSQAKSWLIHRFLWFSATLRTIDSKFQFQLEPIRLLMGVVKNVIFEKKLHTYTLFLIIRLTINV